MPSADLDLLIVGGGPAGLLASTIATKLDLSHMVIERRASTQIHPAAHVIKPHSMEVYRRAGVMNTIFDQGTAPEFQACVTWCESVMGVCYGALDLRGRRGPVPRFVDISPAWPANIPQSVLEPILLARARVLAGDHDVVRFGHELVDYRQDVAGVTALINGPEGQREVRCRYLLGADGAASIVRTIAGIEMEGPMVLANFLAINIRSDMRPVLTSNPGVLIFVRQPDLNGTFIVHQPDGLQVFMLRYDPEKTPLATFDEARCREIVLQALGGPHEFTITGIGPWMMSAQVAQRYRQDRVLLVGDAAHRFPPTGGLGLNTGVEDVDNLLWKLAAVLRGEAGEELLDSYELESRPTALRNCAKSVENNARMALIETALGADVGEHRLAATIEVLRVGDPALANSIEAAIDAQREHFTHLEFEMATVISDGAILHTEREIARPVAEVEGFQPSFVPGGQMPHLWIEAGVSTLDRLRYDCFTLFVPIDQESSWQQTVAELPQDRMPIEILPLDAAASSGGVSAGEFWGSDPYAILVRPDGRIAWVAPQRHDCPDDSLGDAIARLLSLPRPRN